MALITKPLRQLSPEQLWGYASSALFTWGNVDVLKHFLPRILEIVATPSLVIAFVDPEVVFGKLHVGKWETWDEKERTALKTFLVAIWDEILSNPPMESYLVNMETWLCSIGRCEDDLTPYLNQWLMDERLSASLALSNLVCDSAIMENDDSQRSPYWDERDAQYRQLKIWVTSPSVIWKLRSAETRWRNRGLSGHFRKARRLISESANQEFK